MYELIFWQYLDEVYLNHQLVYEALIEEEVVEGLDQALTMKRFKDAWSICLLLNDSEAWKKFAKEAARNLDIDLAIQV